MTTIAARSHLRGIRFWAAMVVFFLLWFVLKLTYFYVGDLERGLPGTLADRALDESTGTFWGLLVAIPLVLLLRRVPPDPSRWRRWVPGYAAFFVVGSILHTLAMVTTRRVLAPPLLGHGYGVGSWVDRLVYEGAGNVLTFLGIAALLALGDSWAARRERERRAEELERTLAAAQLRNLRLQLQPHFLFNALNAVSERMYDDPAAADEMLACLADLLRRSLATADTAEVPLSDELALLEDYVALMRARFGPTLDFVLEVPADLRDTLLPPFLLQPLVENAVRHGTAQLGAGRVLVRAARHAETLVLDVEDDGPGAARSESRGLGIGLRATRERLALLYGTSAAVAAAPRPEGGYRVSVRLPLRRAAREAVAPPAHSGIEVGDARSHR